MAYERITDEMVETAHALFFEEGKSWNEIGMRFGRDPSGIRKRVQKDFGLLQRGSNRTGEADYTTENGAERLAKRIEDYWRKKNVCVMVWIEKSCGHHGKTIYSVRSELVNGAPQ